MKALIPTKAAAGRSLLAVVAISLLLGLAGEAAAVTVSGAVKLNGAFVSGQTVVATTTAPNYCFLREGVTSATIDSSGKNYSFSLDDDQIVACGLRLNQDILIFVHVSDPSFVAALSDSIENVRQFTGANITADFDLVTGVALSGDVTAYSTTLNEPASGVTVFATNPDEGWKFIGQTTTNSDGDYTLFAPPGEETVNSAVQLAVDASKPVKYAALTVDPPFIDLDIKSNRTLVNCSTADCLLNFLLVDALIVRGKVLSDDPSGALNGALVEAFFDDLQKGWIWLDDDLTDGFGAYDLKVPFSFENERILLRVTADGYLEKWVDVTLSNSTNINEVPDITLSKAVVVSGKVTDVMSTAVEGITVLGLANDQSTILAIAETDANGLYSLDLQPNIGNIWVHVVTAGTNFAPEPDVGPLQVTNLDISVPDIVLKQAPWEQITITKAEWVWVKKTKTLNVSATNNRGSSAIMTVTVLNGNRTVVKATPMKWIGGDMFELSKRVNTTLCGFTAKVSSDTGVFAASPISCN